MKKKMPALVLLFLAIIVCTSFIHKNGSANPMPLLGNMDILEGNYRIKSLIKGTYLHLTSGANGALAKVGPATSTQITWRVKKIPNALLGGYTIQNVATGTYLDADFLNTGNNGCKVQGWKRTGPNGDFNPLTGGSPVSINQEWYVQKQPGTPVSYKIANVKSSSMYLTYKYPIPASYPAAILIRQSSMSNSDLIRLNWIFEKQ